MDKFESLSHTAWDCKYHVVFIPKCRRRTLYRQLRQHLGEVFRKLAGQKECRVEEGHLMSDHVHKLRNFLGHKFWARGYFISTVGRDEETICAYIKNHEIADKRLV